MRSARWLLLALVFALLIGTAPTQAQNKNFITINRGSEEEPKDLPTLLSAEEIGKLTKLITGRTGMGLYTSVSPDDQAVWVRLGGQFGFLGVQDGRFSPIDLESFAPFMPLSLIGLGPLAWLDGRTLLAQAVNFEAETAEQSIVYLAIDRITGAVRVLPIHPNIFAVLGALENAVPIGYAPNGTRLLFALAEDASADPTMAMLRVQMTPPDVKNDLMPSPPDRLLARYTALAQRLPGMARLAKPLLGPSADRSALEVTPIRLRLMVADMLGGEVREFDTVEPGSSFINMAWSRDSQRLALTLTGFPDAKKEPRYRYDGALLEEEVYKDVTGQLPPAQNPWLINNAIRIYDMGTGLARVLNARDGDGTFQIAWDWSTDGKTLMVQALHPGRVAGRRYPIYTPQFAERYSYKFYNEELRQVAKFVPPGLAGNGLDAPLNAAMFVSPDEMIFTAVTGTNSQPYYYNLRSGEIRNIADSAGSFFLLSPTNKSRQLVYVKSSYTTPPDFYRVGWDGKALARLTWVNEELRQFSQTKQYPVSFTLRNGQVRNGTLILPAGVSYPPRNARIVVWQEGGPGGAMFNLWQEIVERPYALLPNFDMGLLVVPLSGREGYDAPTYNALANNNNFGQLDIDEQAEIVNQMIAKGWTARGKVGITGCSYGGYFTLMSIVRHPDLYSAANDQCSLVDNIVEWTRGYDRLMPYLEGRDPFQAPQEYQNDSPSYNTDKIKTPLLSFHGTEDFLPIALNENLHSKLIQAGKISRFIKFVGAGHGLVAATSGMPEDTADQYELYGAQEQIKWFRTYLK